MGNYLSKEDLELRLDESEKYDNIIVNVPEKVKKVSETIKMRNSDNVNHPSHYETGKFECIDVMLEVFGKEKVMAFCQCNAFKYLYRMDRKNGIEDLEKARWYINKYQELAND